MVKDKNRVKDLFDDPSPYVEYEYDCVDDKR